MEGIVPAWGRILLGYTPALSIELTRECPLRCPGCYAYGADHLGGSVTLRELADLKGSALVDGVLNLVRRYKPVHVSLVGGEPLVRYRELSDILPTLAAWGVYTQVVTSAVRPIPLEWIDLRRLQVVVSIDGLQKEHDERRRPATYERILKHIEDRRITVHCTVTRQQVRWDGYLEAFIAFWSANPAVRRIWMSLYTPQIAEISAERLSASDRRTVLATLERLRDNYPKLEARTGMLDGFAEPPASPKECIFAKTTHCVSADLRSRVTPCQFGGNPDCQSCGCIASAALAAVGRHRLSGGLRVGAIFDASLMVGAAVRRVRESLSPPSEILEAPRLPDPNMS
ncbi:MAG: radical SAM protein [Acidobacteria bacterium]|nr:radical SAM protein [Acidobacteriota bacterium]